MSARELRRVEVLSQVKAGTHRLLVPEPREHPTRRVIHQIHQAAARPTRLVSQAETAIELHQFAEVRFALTALAMQGSLPHATPQPGSGRRPMCCAGGSKRAACRWRSIGIGKPCTCGAVGLTSVHNARLGRS
jgi:hypothetical protein